MPTELKIKDSEIAALTVLMIARLLNICAAEIIGKTRGPREVCDARHFAIWYLRRRKGISRPWLAGFFHRTETDIQRAIERIDERIELNQDDEGKIPEVADWFDVVIRTKFLNIIAHATEEQREALCA